MFCDCSNPAFYRTFAPESLNLTYTDFSLFSGPLRTNHLEDKCRTKVSTKASVVMWTNPRMSVRSDSLPSPHSFPHGQKSRFGLGGARALEGTEVKFKTLRLSHKVCIKNNPGPQIANVRKITPLIFFSLPQASSRRGIAKLKINVDLETTEAFCFTGLRLFFPLFFQPLSRLAPRPVIFPRIKLSQ